MNFAKSFNDTHVWVHWYSNRQKIIKHTRKTNTFSIRNIKNKITWIKLPTFDIKPEQQSDYLQIIKILPDLRDNTAIIFDLRGNQGGNSSFGSDIVKKLFSESYFNQQRNMAYNNLAVDWRVSAGNIVHMEDLYLKYQEQWMQDIVIGMKVQLKNNKYYYREKFLIVQHKDKIFHKVKAKIIVIIDKYNVSAALDFIDYLKILEHPVLLIGEATRADRLYMEVRTVKLPSGLGTFSFPIKVYRNRVRQDNQPYHPDFKIDLQDSIQLEQFVIDYCN